MTDRGQAPLATGVDVGERLRELVIASDLAGLRCYVDSLTIRDERAAAKAWAAQSQDVDGWPPPPEVSHLDDREVWKWRGKVGWARLLLVGRLGAPVAAVKGVRRWDPGLGNGPIWEQTIAAFVDRGADWATAFVAAADALPLPSQGQGAMLALLMRRLVLVHELPVPSGPLFHGNWVELSYEWNADHELADALRVDPLMPEMLYRHLASGQCGINRHLARAVAVMLDEGRVDRERVLSVVVEQLSANQRVGSVRVLAGVAQTLGLRADEVSGGLPYLLGVLSTAHSSVAKVVLPLAIELVGTDDELTDLARTVALRPEPGLRKALRKQLTLRKLGQRLSAAALVTALDSLAEGEEDVAVRAEIDRAREALGATPTGPATLDEEPVLGLWELEPVRLESRTPRPHWQPDAYATCLDLMRTGTGRVSSVGGVQEGLLDDLATGELTATRLLAAAHELVAEERLSPVGVAHLLEPFFLGGAMRSVWPVALRIAELSAAPVRPGLDKLLRMLSRYAGEVPGTSTLPPRLAALAAGRSKAAQEARRLGAQLARVAPEAYDPRPAAAVPPVPDHLGLHREVVEERRPWELGFRCEPDLAGLRRRVKETPRSADEPGSNTVWASVLDSHVLAELTALIHQHGAEAVRSQLGQLVTDFPGPFVQAVAAWSRGLLTPESYWRLVREGVPVQDYYDAWIEELGSHEATNRLHHLEVAEGLRHDPPIRPAWWVPRWGSDLVVLRFLHTCEALLVAERGGHLLSTPDVSDGSLGLPTLLERLAGAPRVGPLDVRLALGRLRPTVPADAATVAPEVRTDPVLTSVGGDEAVSASDLVRRWLAEGGLTLTPTERADGQGWEYAAEAPIPWTSFAALQGVDVPDLPNQRGEDDVWLVPGRPDLPLRHGFFGARFHYSPADIGGEIGPVGWDRLLLALGAVERPDYDPLDVRTLLRLQGQGRLDPAAAARAATFRWDSETPELIGRALGWSQGFLREGAGALWPLALAVVVAGLRRPERPADLEALVEVLARHVHEVADPHLTPSFAEAAAEPGDSPLHVALRDLVAGVGGAA